MPEPHVTSASPTAPAAGRRLGIAVQGLGGAVATTMVAGLALLRRGLIDSTGLPLARLQQVHPASLAALGLAGYDHISFAGWDLYEADLLTAARGHAVLPPEQLSAVAEELGALRPWRALPTQGFVAGGVGGNNVLPGLGHRQSIERIRSDLESFRRSARLDGLVMLNLSSTEATNGAAAECFASIEALERALDADDPRISPSVLYAYAAVSAGVAHVNFTPTRATDWPAMIELARLKGAPICGKDGKTGQTLLKTALAPALRDRHLVVEGWFSTNLLGNRDGQVLADPESLRSKLATKTEVLDGILGYPVAEHQVHIHYYKPRGDAKEAWDSIDLVGFAGQKMQIKVDFQCRDSVLAAPLAIDLCRLADLAQLRAQGGVVESLGVFFKSPMTTGRPAEHDFFRQQTSLEKWLGLRPGDVGWESRDD